MADPSCAVAVRRRYVTRADWLDSDPVLTTHTVHEPDCQPIRTGLLDANGAPLYRVNDPEPIGFDLTPRIR